MTQRSRLRSSEDLPPLILNPLVYSDKRPYSHSYMKKSRRKIVIFVSQVHGNGLGSNKLDSRIELQELAFLLWSQLPCKMTANDFSVVSIRYFDRDALFDIALELIERIALGSGKRDENSFAIGQTMSIGNALRCLVCSRLRAESCNGFEMQLAIHVRLGKLLKRASV